MVTDLLKRLMVRFKQNLPKNENALAYLRENGITDSAALSAFRVGCGDESWVSELSSDEKGLLRSIGLLAPERSRSAVNGCGVVLPTFDPREPECPVGFIKQNVAQNKHAFASKSDGVACAVDITHQPRVIVTDAPLTALRFSQSGAKGVIVAESAEVLSPLKSWLDAREVILTSAKRPSLEAMRAFVGEKARSICIAGSIGPETASILGIQIEKPAEALPPSSVLLRDLVTFAQARLREGEGAEVLKSLGANNPEFIDAYGLGYLPMGFRSTLSKDARRSIQGDRIAGAVIVPAIDSNGAVVDLFAIHASGDRVQVNLFDAPKGLLAPRVASAFSDVIVTDSFKEAAKLFNEGNRNVLLLRGPEDAASNAARLWSSGVRSAALNVRRHAGEISTELEKAGICKLRQNVEAGTVNTTAEPIEMPAADLVPVASSSSLELIQHDTKSEQATFKAGEVCYSVDVAVDGDSRLEVRMECGGKVHLDRFDLAVEAQRKRFATSASVKAALSADVIDAQLVALLDEVRKLRDSLLSPTTKAKPVVALSESERSESLTLLKRPDLLDIIAKDLESLGWVGEDTSKRLLYLTAISRKLPAPLSAALVSSSGAGKSMSMETIAELVPPEDLLHVSRLTDSSLYYHDKDALRHKLLVIDEADALTPEVLCSLRVLQTRGALTQTHVMRDPVTGSTTTHFIETRGPIAVLTSTAGTLEEQTLSRCFEVAIDESPEQTARVLNIQRKLRADSEYLGAGGRHAKTVARHRNIQRLLSGLAVVIPFADRIEFPASSIKHRREQERFLNLIEASALLHRHQRLKHNNSNGESFIVADVRDYEIAVAIAGGLIGKAADGLSGNGRELLAAVQKAGLSAFTLDDLHALRTDWTRYRFRSGVDELLKLEVLFSASSGRGKAREYSLNAVAAKALELPAVRLLSAREVGELAKVGEIGFANFTSRAAIG